MAAWKDYLEDNGSGYLDELCDFLRIPSISSLPEHADDVRRDVALAHRSESPLIPNHLDNFRHGEDRNVNPILK